MRFTTIAHARHRVLSPISEERIAWLLATLGRAGLRSGADLVDVGCGKAELALRIAERFNAAVTGVDPNAAFLVDARRRAAELGVERRFTAVESIAADADLPERSFDLACCIGSTHAFGGLMETLDGLTRLVRSGGLVLVGDGYWRRPPDAEYLAFLGATEAEFATHHENQSRLHSRGLSLVATWESSIDEWDAYEDLYAGSMRAYLDAHPNDPDGAAFRNRIDAWRAMYLKRGRDTLGFGFYLGRSNG